MNSQFNARRTFAKIFAMLLVLVLASPIFAQTKPVIVFVVSPAEGGEASVDAALMVENGKFKPPYAEESKEAQNRFATQFFPTRMHYRLTFGGGEVGTISIIGTNEGCNNIHATANVVDDNRIPKHLSSLATNSETIGKKSVSRRSPTTAERAALMKLVEQIYRSRRTTAAQLRTLSTTNLTATDLDGDGKLEMVGSFVIKGRTQARRDLFLVAEPQGTSFKAAYVNYQAYTPEIEDFHSAIDFVDQLDVDGDGFAEVFTTQRGFDAYGYNIYKKVRGRWREVLRTIGDAC